MGGENPSEAPFGDGPFPENVLEKNKIVDGVFSEEAESEMDGDESFSFSLLNGKPQIKISPKVLEEVWHQWKNSLIVKLLGKAIKCDALCNKACALWNLRGGFKALDLGESYFLFTFQSMEDRMRVYTEGPWVVMDHFLSICKWEPNFKPSEGRRVLRTAVWVRFIELPVEFLHDKILYHVAKSLGRPIKVDHSAQGKFARVCIEINLSKPLCPVIEVEGKDCTVEYESLHFFCFDGSCFGQLKVHNRDGDTILEEAEHKSNQLEVGSKTIREDGQDTVKPKETEKANDSLSDPASLPSKLDEIDIPKDLNVEVEALVNFEGDSHDCVVKDETKSDSRYEIPDAEFCNFDERPPEEAEHKTNQLEVSSKTIREDGLDTVKPKESPETSAHNPFMGKTPSPFTSFNPQQQQPQKPSFWTVCPHCKVKYQYYRDVVNKYLSCQRCKKIFIGHEIKDQPTVHPTPFSFKPNNGVKVGSQGNASFVPRTKEPVAKAGTSEVRRDTKPEPKVTAKVNGKRKKIIDERESSDSDSSSESEEEDITEENGDVKVTNDFGCFRENLRRSSRSKTNVSYKENLSDDEDLASGSKKAKSSGSFCADEDPVLEREVPKTNQSEDSSTPIEENKSEKENADLKEPENGGEINV